MNLTCLKPVGKSDNLGLKPHFWGFLRMFLGDITTSNIETYLMQPSTNNSHPTSINRLENVIAMATHVHHQFGTGKIILEPVGDPLADVSSTNPLTTYDVRFSYLHKNSEATLPTHNSVSQPDTSTPSERACLLCYQAHPALYRFGARRTGDIINFSTSDPVSQPLPHPDLLRIHAAISRIQCMAGRGSLQEEDLYDGPDELLCPVAIPVEDNSRIAEWIETVSLDDGSSTNNDVASILGLTGGHSVMEDASLATEQTGTGSRAKLY